MIQKFRGVVKLVELLLDMWPLYVLKYRKPIRCYDYRKYERFFTNFRNRRVRVTYINECKISTVFLCVAGALDSDPLLFETMVFLRVEESTGFRRCKTWRQALIQHRSVVTQVKNLIFNQENNQKEEAK